MWALSSPPISPVIINTEMMDSDHRAQVCVLIDWGDDIYNDDNVNVVPVSLLSASWFIIVQLLFPN